MNGHDHVACTLLNSGADVTLVDDSGLTAVDVAKTKKVKNTLKEVRTKSKVISFQAFNLLRPQTTPQTYIHDP